MSCRFNLFACFTLAFSGCWSIQIFIAYLLWLCRSVSDCCTVHCSVHDVTYAWRILNIQFVCASRLILICNNMEHIEECIAKEDYRMYIGNVSYIILKCNGKFSSTSHTPIVCHVYRVMTSSLQCVTYLASWFDFDDAVAVLRHINAIVNRIE